MLLVPGGTAQPAHAWESAQSRTRRLRQVVLLLASNS